MKIPKVSIEEFFTLPEDEQVYFMEVISLAHRKAYSASSFFFSGLS